MVVIFIYFMCQIKFRVKQDEPIKMLAIYPLLVDISQLKKMHFINNINVETFYYDTVE